VAGDGEGAGLPVSVEGMRDDTVEAERERALPGAARTEEEEPLALLPFKIEVTKRRSLAPDVSDG